MKMNWWAKNENAKKWIDQVEKHKDDPTYTEQPNIVLEALKDEIKRFDSIMEVGSGTGHLIGAISEKYDLVDSCHAIDVNKKLLNYVEKKYLNVRTYNCDITGKYEFINKKPFDLVFTYQVLQHIPPEEIPKVIENLKKLAKKEVWLWEGIGRVDYKDGTKTHDAHSGSWYHDITKYVDCYEVSIPKTNKLTLPRQRLYKIKV